MFKDFSALTPRDRYKLLVATVIPRPIALVTTKSTTGVLNAAPFSFFNIFSEDPALAILGMDARHGDDGLKDTTQNILDTGELVINLVDRDLAEAMAACAASLDPDEDELVFAGLTPHASRIISVPGIAEAPVRLECTVFEMRQITPQRHLCLAEIHALSARDGVLDPDTFRVSLENYHPIGRLFGNSYAEVKDAFELPVPNPPRKEAP